MTAQHTVVGLKHDAATVWVENVNSNTFLACSREMQNFDGLHKDIKLVSYYETLNNSNASLLLFIVIINTLNT